MTVLTRNDQWWIFQFADQDLLMMRCPYCAKVGMLDSGIRKTGESIDWAICPYKGCNFHDIVKLDGWESLKSLNLMECF